MHMMFQQDNFIGHRIEEGNKPCLCGGMETNQFSTQSLTQLLEFALALGVTSAFMDAVLWQESLGSQAASEGGLLQGASGCLYPVSFEGWPI